MMSSGVDESGRLLDPEAEVRKLQQLVARLTEERNLYLKNNGNLKDSETSTLPELSLSEDKCIIHNKQNIHHTSDTDNVDNAVSRQKGKHDSPDVSLDDVELLDLDSLDNLEEEDSWLYSSPKKLTTSQKSISPYKWVREEFARADLQSAGRSFLYKLDELSKTPPIHSAGSLSPVDSQAPLCGTDNRTNTVSTVNMPHIRKPLMGLGSRVDTSTFTRPKKRSVITDNSAVVQLSDSPSPRSSPRNTPEANNNAFTYRTDENANSHSGASSGSQESLGTTHRLADVTDVQVLARMQEDSLRQSFHSPKKAPSQSVSRSTFGLFDIDNGSGSNRSSPGQFDSEIYQNVKRSNNSLASLSSNSTSSPPNSPYSSQYLEPRTQAIIGSEGHRSSLPNLARNLGTAGTRLPSHSSDPRLRERSTPSPTQSRTQLQPPSRGHHSPTTRASPFRQLKTPQSRRSDSPGRGLSPGRKESTLSLPQGTYSSQPSVHTSHSPQRRTSPGQSSSPHTNVSPDMSPDRNRSPQRSGVPSPARSGIPRPGSASKLPTSRRSSIPSMRRSLATPRNADDSWKDGCF